MNKQLYFLSVMVIWGAAKFTYAGLPDFHKEEMSKKEGIFFHSFFAPCASSTPPSKKELRLYLDKMNMDFESEEKSSKTVIINGIEFYEESKFYLDLFDRLTTAENNDHLVSFNKEQEDIVALVNNDECKKVQCALNQIFGDVSLQYQYMLARFGYNPSDLVFERAQRMNEKQANLVLIELENLPTNLTKLHSNHRLTIGGFTLTNSRETYANASIALLPNWELASIYKQKEAVFHEVAHNIDTCRGYRISEQQDWLKISGWDEVEKFIVESNKMPSSYSRTNVSEHFAESILHYRYWPQNLHSDIFEYIKANIFEGNEYTDNKSCFHPTTDTNNRIDEIEKEISFHFLPQEKFRTDCTFSSKYSESDSTNLRECLRSEYYFYQIENDHIPNLVRDYFIDIPLDSSIESRESEIAYITQSLRNKYLKNIDESQGFVTVLNQDIAIIESSLKEEIQKWRQRVSNINLSEPQIDSYEFESHGYKTFKKIISDCSEEIINDFLNDSVQADSCLAQSLHDYYWNISKYKYALSYSGKVSIDDNYKKKLSDEAEVIMAEKSKVIASQSHKLIVESIKSKIKNKIVDSYKISEWKKKKLYKSLSKDDFCKEYYSINLNQFDANSIEESLFKTCVKMQNKNKRFFFSEEMTDSILEEIKSIANEE
jgi:hypothetical protein